MKKSLNPHKKFKDKKSLPLWKLSYKWFEPAQEALREALCTLGNGYFCTRGAANESTATGVHYPGTYIAGVYDKLATRLAGKVIVNEDLVNCPNWLFLTFRIGEDDWITPSTGKNLFYRQELDMRRGILVKDFQFRDWRGRVTTIETQRLVHMADPHRSAIRYVITPENYEGWIVVRASLDGAVQNTGVERYRQLNSLHLRGFRLGTFNQKDGLYLLAKTRQSNIGISQAARVRIFVDGKEIRPKSQILIRQRREIAQDFRIYVHRKRRYEIEKIVGTYVARKNAPRGHSMTGKAYLGYNRNPLKAAIKSVQNSDRFDAYLKSHVKAWADLWRRFDIHVEGSTFSQVALRLHIFHLLQTASFHNTLIDAGLPARGLHGEAYRGHIFWDGIFVMSFYNLHAPQISKAILLYRYRRLAQARRYARYNGYKGAMFPWQSASTGEEETQIVHLNPISGRWGPDYSRVQRHVSFAIAYNVWQYWRTTRDTDFFTQHGAEILLSISQFAASLLKYSSKDGKFHTYGVMGPDEFHEKMQGASKPGLKDNAYTNLLISWLLSESREFCSVLPDSQKERLLQKLGLTDKNLEEWQEMAKRINIIINDKGIISQFDGYFRLKELDMEAYRHKYAKIQRMDRILKAEGKSPNDYKIAKQADVLTFFYLFPFSQVQEIFHMLGYRFDKSILKKNYNYYVKRTSHGSTLSKVVHCYVAHMLGKYKESWKWFIEVLESDIYDTQGGTTSEGIHTGVMGGSIDIILRGFAGIKVFDDRISIDPKLPVGWPRINLRFCYQGRHLSLSITKNKIKILISGSKSKKSGIPVEIRGRIWHLYPARTYRISLKKRKNVET